MVNPLELSLGMDFSHVYPTSYNIDILNCIQFGIVQSNTQKINHKITKIPGTICE